MVRLRIYGAVLAATAALVSLPTSAVRAGEPVAANGVIVLKSGGVLRGEIVHAGDRYLVQSNKSQLDVPAGQVVLVCDSLESAYAQQRGQLVRPTAEAHLTLAEWCLRYDLKTQATQEIAEARRLDGRHPRLALLERRLAVLNQPRVAAPTKATTADDLDDDQADKVRALDAMAAELPAGALERFTRKVQPMLVNNCTTSGCHQSGGGQEFQLDRAVLHGLSNRRTTLGNLEATLALVDRAAPDRSRLLSIPLEAHGGRKPPLLGKNQDEHLELLAEWIALATGTTLPRAEIAAAEIEAAPSKWSEPRPPTDARSMLTPAAKLLAEQEAAESLAGMPPVRYGVEAASWQPKDEFDPEIFNRRFGAPASERRAPLPPTGNAVEQRVDGETSRPE